MKLHQSTLYCEELIVEVLGEIFQNLNLLPTLPRCFHPLTIPTFRKSVLLLSLPIFIQVLNQRGLQKMIGSQLLSEQVLFITYNLVASRKWKVGL